MEHLIAAVRKYPCLWNTTAIEYRDQELKEAAWAEVVKETDLSSVKEVKMKWKKLRDSYRDALKRQGEAQAGPGGQPPRKSYAWKYSSLMHFLQPYMSARKKPAGAPPPPALDPPALDENGHDAPSSDESDSSAEVEPKRKAAAGDRLALLERRLDLVCRSRRKRPGTEPPPPAPPAYPAYQAYPTAPDSLDVFFSSMCQSTKRLPYPTQIKIKRLVFEAVIEAEEKLIAEQQSYASLWAARGASSSSSEPEAGDGDRS